MTTTKIDQMNFEQALAELETVVGRLEAGNVALEDSIDLYSRGTKLKLHCEAKLKSAEAKIEKLTLGPDGSVTGRESLDGSPF